MQPKETRNFYKILGVSVTATPKQITDAYHEKAKEYHPDKFSNADEEGKRRAENYFKDINAAYETLSDSKKRMVYKVGYVANNLGPNYENLKGMFTSEQLFEALSFGYANKDSIEKYFKDRSEKLLGTARSAREGAIIGTQFVGVMGRRALKTADEYLMKAMRKIRGIHDDEEK